MSFNTFKLDELATLDPEIQPQNVPVDLSAKPDAIFLTGVTGFVGAFLLRDLLEQTGAIIYGLVRGKTAEHGMQRIRQNLESYGIWREEYAARIVPVTGDLKLPRFELTETQFHRLGETVDVVYHCGSKLSYIAPYEYLHDANVGGTQEALRLSVTGKAKACHFVSSLGILLAYKDLVGGQEDADLDASKCPDVGYFQTKYVAERVVRIARKRGIPVTIHRIGLIVGDSQTGVSNPDDFVARMLLGSIQAGYAPDVKSAMDMTPVDYVSRAMVYLSQQPSSVGQVFHLLNPSPIHWSNIFDMVAEAGYPVHKLPFEGWVEALAQHADPDNNPLYPMLPFLQIPFARRMLGISESHFQALGTYQTQEALRPSGLVCRQIDREMVQIFLARFVANGYLPKLPAGFRMAEQAAEVGQQPGIN